MKNLKAWQKMLLIGAVSLVPFTAVTLKMVSSVDELGIEFARQEVRGLGYYAPLMTLLRDLQRHRDLMIVTATGDAQSREALESAPADVERDVKAVDAAEQRLGAALRTADKWTNLKSAIGELLARAPTLSLEESTTRHSRLIGDVLALITHVGDVSNLTFDPDLDSYYLMNVAIIQGPELSEMLARARAFGAEVAASSRTVDHARRLQRHAVLVEFLDAKVDESMTKAFESNPGLKSQLEAHADQRSIAVLDALSEIVKVAGSPSPVSDPARHVDTLSRGVDAIFELESRVAASLTVLLEKRIAKFRNEVLHTLVWAALGLLVVSLIGLFAIRNITRTLDRVVRAANQIAVGDLAVEDGLKSGKDEIGVLARAFDKMVVASKEMVGVAERIAAGDLAVVVTPRSDRDALGHALAHMVERLSALVAEVQRSGVQVDHTVTEIAATAKQQQATATEIAATTTEISATSREIAATSKELVKTMSEVAGVADQSAALAGEGQHGLTRMAETMRQVIDAAGSINTKLAVLNEKAGNINQVVTTITKVADQTNLLSLNAAIEAEKAGEYGRGFAVVATEIRRLADQTAIATHDIAQMVKEIQSAVSAGVMGMDKFSEQVRRGMQDVQQVADQLSQIIQQVQALAPRFDAVNEGMQAQATGAEQITEALAQLSGAVEQTVESLRQSTTVIDTLDQAAAGMRAGASRFKVAA